MNDEIVAKNLIDEVNFQDGSIVSKQLLKKPNGNITFFAFGKEESLTEHTSPYEAFIYLAEGKMEIRIDGKPVVIKSGQQIILPPNVPHALKAIADSKMLLIMIK
jgi:quercetin dioxygenase-like cupin family protein